MEVLVNIVTLDTDLTLMSSVYKDMKLNLLITIHPDRCRNGYKYFKIYDNVSYNKSNKVTLISFEQPNYIDFIGDLKPYKLLEITKEYLCHILTMPSYIHKNKSNWEVLKFTWNWEVLDFSINYDDYFSGRLDNQYNHISDYIPSTLEMPDYMNL
jgi:hypothetical protein